MRAADPCGLSGRSCPHGPDALPPKRTAVSRRVAYRVRQGDSLARIAKRYRVTVADIVGWNAQSPKAYLQPGSR